MIQIIIGRMSLHNERTQSEKEAGQLLVEFALVLMFVILPFMFVLIDGAMTLYSQSAITNAAREGARAGSIFQTTTPPSFADPFATQVAVIDAARTTYIRAEIQRMIGPLLPYSSCTTTIAYPDTDPGLPEMGNPYRDLDSISVTAACPRRLFFGLVGTSQITLTAQSTMRIEPGGVAVPIPSP